MADRGEWAKLLREIAASAERRPSAVGAPDHGELVAPWFWNARRGVPGTPKGTSTDEHLWCACGGSPVDVDRILADLARTMRTHADMGALVPQGAHHAIEVWTETEFSALHALSRLARMHARHDWDAAALSHAQWHLDQTQPDNATNHPWAVHLFVRLAAEEGDAAARLMAETMVHDCRVMTGTPDRLSAEILIDAAELLEATPGTPAPQPR